MSNQLRDRNYITVSLVILVLALGLLSVFQFSQNQSLSGELGALKKGNSTSTTHLNEGLIMFRGIGLFEYKRVTSDNFKPGTSLVFKNVTFQNLPLNVTYTGCIVQFIKVVFQDGFSETIQIISCPTLFEPSVVLTNHSRPRAGIIYVLGESFMFKGIYLLVEEE